MHFKFCSVYNCGMHCYQKIETAMQSHFHTVRLWFHEVDMGLRQQLQVYFSAIPAATHFINVLNLVATVKCKLETSALTVYNAQMYTTWLHGPVCMFTKLVHIETWDTDITVFTILHTLYLVEAHHHHIITSSHKPQMRLTHAPDSWGHNTKFNMYDKSFRPDYINFLYIQNCLLSRRQDSFTQGSKEVECTYKHRLYNHLLQAIMANNQLLQTNNHYCRQ